MNIAVYLGSTSGKKPIYAKLTEELGSWIGESGNTLIYGGSKTGLMNILADATLKEGGKVIGVELDDFVADGRGHDKLTEFHSFPTLEERKRYIRSISDASIALPGGTGTLDEISEVMVLERLHTPRKPVIIYNMDHYYDPLKKQIEDMFKEGFLNESDEGLITFCTNLEEIKEALK